MSSYSKQLKNQAEKALNDPNFDFIATYHAVSDLRRLAKNTPDTLDEQTLLSLKELLESNAFHNVRQAYFLYREAAKGLTDIILMPQSNGLGAMALETLQDLLTKATGSAHRGIAEAMGSLPLDISGPKVCGTSCFHSTRLSWNQLLSANQLTIVGRPKFIGRSLVARTTDNKNLLVLKLAKSSDTPYRLINEIRWMAFLKKQTFYEKHLFHIPKPLHLCDSLVEVSGLPLCLPSGVERHPDGWAIAFLADPAYFRYPNSNKISSTTALEILGRNAFLLGRLAAAGVIHNAPIPLFHNRTQRLRRDDQGRYQWFRAGRLDQWLDSCAFPNLGMSGIRDFEHFETFDGNSRTLYRHIGTHLFSLLLICGSCFRCKDKTRKGLDNHQQPLDTRDLFDRQLLRQMVQEIFVGYYTGFTELPTVPPIPFDLDNLTHRMIDEMGIDRYMTELLRRTDQNELTDGEFSSFLLTKGYTPNEIKEIKRGEKDLLITSGPHLGDFNRRISLPELVESTAAMSALCIAGHYTATYKGWVP